jgi:hypothetical protein
MPVIIAALAAVREYLRMKVSRLAVRSGFPSRGGFGFAVAPAASHAIALAVWGLPARMIG